MASDHKITAEWYLKLLAAERLERPEVHALKDPEDVKKAEKFLTAVAGDTKPNDAFREVFPSITRPREAMHQFLHLAKVLCLLAPDPAKWTEKEKGFGCSTGYAFMKMLAVLKSISEGYPLRSACELQDASFENMVGWGVRSKVGQGGRAAPGELRDEERKMVRATTACRSDSSLTITSIRRTYLLSREQAKKCFYDARKEVGNHTSGETSPARANSRTSTAQTTKAAWASRRLRR